MLLHGETKWWGAWWGISEWLDAGVNSLAGRRHFDLVECICGEKANHLGGGFGIEVLVIAAAHTRHRLKSVYMDYVADVRPAGPPFPRMVARWVGISPASGQGAARSNGFFRGSLHLRDCRSVNIKQTQRTGDRQLAAGRSARRPQRPFRDLWARRLSVLGRAPCGSTAFSKTVCI